MSNRENILAALQAKFDKLGSGVTSWRSREAALARAEGPAIITHPEEESAELLANGMVRRDFGVVVTVIARGQIPDKVADGVVERMHNTLTADQTLGGLCARIVEESTKWDFENADMSACIVEVRYRFRYITPATSLAILS